MFVAARPDIEVQELTSFPALQALRPEWEALWQRSVDATPFQSPRWLLPWWEHFGGPELWCLALRHNGELVGLAPLFIWESTVLLMGTGITDYLDVLIDPEWRECGMTSIECLIARQSHRFKRCDFQQLRSKSPLLALSDDAAIQDVCPVLDLRGEIPMLKKARYYLRRAASVGEVRIEAATEQNFKTFFLDFLRLHNARWGEAAVLRDSALQNFHREVAREFLEAEMLRLYLLYLGGKAAAAWYGFQWNGRLYYYLGGFDPEFKGLSPGAIVVGHAIEQAIASGVTELDFLRGQERYKYLWGARDRFTYRMRFKPSAPGLKVAACGHS